MEQVSMDQIKDSVIVFLAIAGAIVLIGNAVKTIKGWRQPADDMASWRRETDRKLAEDKKRLDSIEDGNKVMTRGILALISHEINGNSIDKLTRSQQEITDYLIER